MAIFEGGDVSLTENIKKEKFDFVNTRSEWAANNRDQIVKFSAGSGTSSFTKTIFEVPKGFDLFITHASIGCSVIAPSVAGSSGAGLDIIKNTNSNEHIIGLALTNRLLTDLSYQISSNFSMPIKVPAGAIVSFRFGGVIDLGNSVGTINGWLEPRRLA